MILLSYLESASFVLLQSLVQKLQSLNLGLKVSDLGIFGLEFEKILAIFEISFLEFVLWQSISLGPNQSPRICLIW